MIFIPYPDKSGLSGPNLGHQDFQRNGLDSCNAGRYLYLANWNRYTKTGV